MAKRVLFIAFVVFFALGTVTALAAENGFWQSMYDGFSGWGKSCEKSTTSTCCCKSCGKQCCAKCDTDCGGKCCSKCCATK